MNCCTKFCLRRKWLTILLLCIVVAGVCGCQTIGYYAQAVHGESQILLHKKPIDKLIADPQTPADLRQKLQLIQELRAFARDSLKLPAEDNYLKYVDIHRPYVVWNVQAAPRFSLQPRTWWYPFVGRAEYRGYFSEKGALRYAAHIEKKGEDVYVDGIEAYSTLGWFKDPILNTFLDHKEPELAEILFHELGHKRVFCRGDTDFNEAYATTVGQEGARRWLRASGRTNLLEQYATDISRDNQFVHLVLNTRLELEKIYGDTLDKDGKVKAAKVPPLPPEQLQAQKDRVIADLRNRYQELKKSWGGYSGYDGWFARHLNNAQLNTIANYYDYLPSFKHLLELNGGDMERFYQAVEKLSKLPKEERHQRLRDLAKTAGS